MSSHASFRFVLCMLAAAMLVAQPASAQVPPVEPPTRVAPQPTSPVIRMPDAPATPARQESTEPAASESSANPKPFDPAAYRAAVRSAQSALDAQDWAGAARSLEQVLEMKPDSKEAAYNLGVARFQQGDFVGARSMFQQSAQNASADLAARSMYNEGNAIYADAVRTLVPVEGGRLPVGVVCALAGGPAFLVLLRRGAGAWRP